MGMSGTGGPPTEGSAEGRVASILLRAGSDEPPFQPTELYPEGSMLRLLLDAHHRVDGGLPIPVVDGAGWYYEARLKSAFAHQTLQSWYDATFVPFMDRLKIRAVAWEHAIAAAAPADDLAAFHSQCLVHNAVDTPVRRKLP